jgi:hypothetical protein
MCPSEEKKGEKLEKECTGGLITGGKIALQEHAS